MITTAFDESDGTCDYHRVHAQLVRWGCPLGWNWSAT